MIRPGINVFAIIAYSTGLIVGFGSVGAVIGLVIAFATMFSEMANYGLIGFLIIALIGGIGMAVGAAIGIVVAIIIGLKSTPNKTKGDYFKIIGIPLAIVLIIVLWVYVPILRDEKPWSQEDITPTAAPVARPAPEASAQGPDLRNFVPCNAFLGSKDLERNLHVQTGDRVRISLCSNPTPGFQWSQTAQISDESILKQRAMNGIDPGYIAYATDFDGVPLEERWSFDALTEGTSTVLLENSSPLEGSPVEWSLTATITVN